MTAAALALVLGAAPLRAASPFVEQLRKAQTREASDPERMGYAGRAIRIWTPADGKSLLAHAHFARAEGELAGFYEEAAEADLTKVLELDHRNRKALLMRSSTRLALGLRIEAENDAKEYVALAPEDGEGWLALGEARLSLGLPKADAPARQAFVKAAAKLDPDDSRPLIGEGRAKLAAREPKDALKAFEAAAEKPRERLPEILSWTARAQADLGDWAGVEKSLGGALPSFEVRVDQRRRAGAPARAVDSARRELADGFFRRGVAREALERPGDAADDYRQACEHGHAAACARADALARRAAPAPKAAAAAPEPKAKSAPKPAPAAVRELEPPDPPKPPKKRRRNPDSDAGDRIYAN